MKVFFWGIFFLFVNTIWASTIKYEVKMPEPQSHYFEVTMNIVDYEKDYVDVKMPVWAPGSYLIREFEKNIENINAFSNDKKLVINQLDKNTWRIITKKSKNVKITYSVYAFEQSVRTSFLDASHGYFNGSSIFMFVKELLNKPITLTIVPFKEWKKVSTSLNKTSETEFIYTAPNYDVLVDCPVEIGNHETFSFNAAGVEHSVAIVGKGNFDMELLKIDMAKVVEAVTAVYGENPNKNYTFIIHNLTKGGGGLEHQNSVTIDVDRWTYQGDDYKGFLSVVAHEYFHIWNVKRIRPSTLVPFDYSAENYTDLLWVMEGFTSYYDELLLYRAGYFTEEEMVKKFTNSINSIENQPGNSVQSVTESSFNAWVKGYRPNENSYNSTVSYYTKGSVIANMLDLMIAESTKGTKSLDDVMKYLYEEFYKKQRRGITIEDVQSTLEKISGLNLNSFFNDYVNGTKSFDYQTIFGYANVNVDTYKSQKVSLGITTTNNIIKTVTKNSSAFKGGLNANDEIIGMDGFRVDNNINDLLKNKQLGDTVDILVSRDNILINLSFPLLENDSFYYKLSTNNDNKNNVYNKWLKKL